MTEQKRCHGLKVGVFQNLVDNEAGDPAIVAKRAEELGFAHYWVPDHTIIPEGSADIYPGKQEGEPPPEYLFKMPDPFIALARASATTTSIGLGTGVALVPERNPINSAKEIASLDHYSGGRFLFGIGAGWNEPECTTLGGDFPRRWTQTTEAIEVMRKLWSGDYVAHDGKYYNFPSSICKPTPHQRSGPPVLLGSIGSPRVFKRVAKWGDGWLPFCADPQELADGRAELDKHAKEVGRDPASIDMTLFAPDSTFRTKAELKAVADTGANGSVVWLQGGNADELTAELESLAGDLFG
ncbi:MAG: LLM class F420-dependent oxidoreductase [Gammaproteobacteria bacterium]